MGRVAKAPKVLTVEPKAPSRPFPAEPDPRLWERPTGGGVEVPEEPPLVRTLMDAQGLSETALVQRAEADARLACACEDAACLDPILDANRAWYQGIRDREINAVDFARIERAVKRLFGCAARIKGDAGGGSGEPPEGDSP